MQWLFLHIPWCPDSMVFWYHLFLGEQGEWCGDGLVNPAQLWFPQYSQPCPGLSAGLLGPPPPAVDKKCWEKRLSQDMGCSPI